MNVDEFNEEQVEKENDRVLEVLTDLSYDYYFISPILKRFNLRSDVNFTAVAGVDNSGRGLFNPLLTANLTNEEVKFILLHEAFHVLLNHMGRYEAKNGKNYSNFAYWNIAADAYINENLSKNLDMMIDNMVTFDYAAEMSGLNRNEIIDLTTEELYDAIVDHQGKLVDEFEDLMNQLKDLLDENDVKDSSDSNSDNSQSNGGGSNNNSGSQGTGGASGLGNGNINPAVQDAIKRLQKRLEEVTDELEKSEEISSSVTSEKEVEQINEAFDEEELEYERRIIENEAEDIKKALDIQCSNDYEFIKDAINKSIKWKRVLKDFVSEVSGKHHVSRSWQHPSRKYRDIYPVTKGRKRNKTKSLVFSVDVSGSMDREKIQAVIRVINSFTSKNRVKCDYYFFSHRRYDTLKFKNMDEFVNEYKKVAGGGTSFESAINCGDVDGIVIISDMEFDFFEEKTLRDKKIPYKFLDIAPADAMNGVKRKVSKSKQYTEVW